MEVNEKGYEDSNFDYEKKRQKAIEKGLGCEFIIINLDKKDFDIYVEIGKIYNRISESNE